MLFISEMEALVTILKNAFEPTRTPIRATQMEAFARKLELLGARSPSDFFGWVEEAESSKDLWEMLQGDPVLEKN